MPHRDNCLLFPSSSSLSFVGEQGLPAFSPWFDQPVFPSLSSFSGFSRLGCLASSSCNTTMNGTILGAAYTVTLNCCNTDKCNNGAGSIQLSLTAAVGAALVATALNSWH
ncbi:hypothetical protein JZ751_004309 [Albula glossodonta]|uniref:UPAR/Ly6 domain-containing protein n=1 Tax=Albula glossodonta TaxID=121402 RepID=A0A8T2ND24_9TELE|nr:hypothetical protein JZ751_004309 [Albula glossodonta]